MFPLAHKFLHEKSRNCRAEDHLARVNQFNGVDQLGWRCVLQQVPAGAEPEDLLRLDVPCLVVPGCDHAHAISAARYLEECVLGAEYWDAAVADQTEHTAPARLLTFLESAAAR